MCGIKFFDKRRGQYADGELYLTLLHLRYNIFLNITIDQGTFDQKKKIQRITFASPHS